MRKIYLLLWLCCVLLPIQAKSIFSGQQTLNWKVQMNEDYLPQEEILFFDDAVFTVNALPHFQKAVLLQDNVSAKAFVDNAVYDTLTAKEQEIVLKSKVRIPTELEVKSREFRDNYKKCVEITFLPIMNVDGQLKKIRSFSLNVTAETLMRSKASGLHSFAQSSVLKSGKWLKMRVSESGIYKITYQQIVDAGLNPDDVHVFGYGGAMLNEDFSKNKIDDLPQLPFYMDKGADGVFNSGDYILFYAQGPLNWVYNTTSREFQHNVNPYSTHGYYFLASGLALPQNIIPTSDAVELQGRTPLSINTFSDYFLHENDLVSLLNSGRVFYGEEYNSLKKTASYSFNIPNLVEGSQAIMTIDAAFHVKSTSSARPYIRTEANETSVNIQPASNIRPDDYYTQGVKASRTFSFTPVQALTVNTTLNENGLSGTKGWLNYIRVTALRNLVMTGNVMPFRNVGFTASTVATFNITTDNDLMVLDITDQMNVKRINTTFNQGQRLVTFTVENNENTIREYVAVNLANAAAISQPEMVGSVENQDLHGLENYEFVIITHPDFTSQAQQLAQAHRDRDNLSVLVVTPEKIYNEFSSGTPDASAYRWFAKMFYDRKAYGTDDTELKYLLLFGDGSYDNRQILSTPDGNNKLLTFQSYNSLVEAESSGVNISYVSDDYFGFLDDTEGVNLHLDKLDIGVGRFPVVTKAQADAVLNKTLKYMANTSRGSWKNMLCFLGDDGDADNHIQHADEVAKKIEQSNPEFQIMKLYMDAYKQVVTNTGQEYPEVREKLHNQIKKGLLLLNYSGHGSTSAWSNEAVMTNADIISMYNENQALWVTATCDFSRFDAAKVTAGENVLLNPNGGGIALFTTTRVVYTGPNKTLNLKFADYVFSKDENGKRRKLGDIIKLTKRNMGSVSASTHYNKLNFTLLGDPALTLSYPTHHIVTDSINGVGASDSPVTIGALSRVTLKGHVTDEDGNEVNNFNGYVSVSVFDKEQTVNLLNNDNCSGCGTYKYKDRSIISLGKTEVVNGEFEVTFMVPKDINYTLGTGKMIYYACDDENELEANGSFTNFTVGGSGSGVFDDDEGPEIQMYINTPEFASGDRVNESPLFVAHVADENGINVIGNGIGHDVSLMWNNKDWIIINDYYEPDFGTFKSGTVKYKMQDLADGRYTLNFRVWDLLNNSSGASLEFEVVKGHSIGILDAYCYPNPATEQTSFVLKHNRPDEVLDVTIRVYDLSGRQLWEYESNFYATDDVVKITDWNLFTNSGRRLQRGVYLYKVEVSSRTTNKISTKTKKIIVN